MSDFLVAKLKCCQNVLACVALQETLVSLVVRLQFPFLSDMMKLTHFVSKIKFKIKNNFYVSFQLSIALFFAKDQAIIFKKIFSVSTHAHAGFVIENLTLAVNVCKFFNVFMMMRYLTMILMRLWWHFAMINMIRWLWTIRIGLTCYIVKVNDIIKIAI